MDETNDLANVSDLSDGSLVRLLKKRYESGRIYTNIGDILLLCNPFAEIDGLYENEMHARHVRSVGEHPHIFSVSDAAYHSMMDLRQKQCCIVSGDSGSGKTHSANQMLSHIMYLCKANAGAASIQQQILQVNPLLEAFGNARTTMNDNSSRFGKYTELIFSIHGQVLGASISEYLLEKSRVVSRARSETNFHIFYYLFETPHAPKLRLESPLDFRYLDIETLDMDEPPSEEAAEVFEAFQIVGFSALEMEECVAVLAAVLHLGNIVFTQAERDTAASLDSESKELLAYVAELLKVDSNDLAESLLQHVGVTRQEEIVRRFSKAEAKSACDSLAKSLYRGLFAWIVAQINRLLSPASSNKDMGVLDIGILDIFGFEHFEQNRFEQFCINLANEQLQLIFNKHVFELEQEEYRKEGVDAAAVSYTDNKELLSMFLGKVGLISLLDDETLLSSSTPQSLVDKFGAHHGNGSRFRKSKRTEPKFTIVHYAGHVTYTADNFVFANRDRLQPDTCEVLVLSNNNIVTSTFLGQTTQTGAIIPFVYGKTDGKNTRGRKAAAAKDKLNLSSRRGPSLGLQFKNSLQTLTDRLAVREPHFVRCIKPNPYSVPEFDVEYTMPQLRYTGVLETVRIRQEGYAYRPTFESFIKLFGPLCFNAKVVASAENCRKILSSAGIGDFKVGHTKVFLRHDGKLAVEAQLHRLQTAAKVMQKVARGRQARQKHAFLIEQAEAQEREVLSFADLLETLGASAALRCRKLDRQDDARSSHAAQDAIAQAKQKQDEEKEQEEQAERVAHENALRGTLDELEQKRKLMEERSKEFELLAQAREKERLELEERLADEAEQLRLLKETEMFSRIALEERLQIEADKAESERQLRLASEKEYMAQLAERQAESEEQRQQALAEQLKIQQQLREQHEQATHAKRAAEELLLEQQDQWKALHERTRLERDEAETMLRNERGRMEQLELIFDELTQERDDLSRKCEDLTRQLEEEKLARQSVESRSEATHLAVSQSGEQLSQLHYEIQDIADKLFQARARATAAEIAKEEAISKSVRTAGMLSQLQTSNKHLTARIQAQEKRIKQLEASTADDTASRNDVAAREHVAARVHAAAAAIREYALGRVSEPGAGCHLASYLEEVLPALPKDTTADRLGLCGWLYKAGSLNTSYQKRWFVLSLSEKTLIYATDPMQSNVKGNIKLADIVFVGADPSAGHGIVVGTHKRIYQLKAETEDEQLLWIEAIRVCLPLTGSQERSSAEQMVEIEAVRQQYKKEIARLIEYNQQLQNGVVAEFDQRQLAQRQLEVASRSKPAGHPPARPAREENPVAEVHKEVTDDITVVPNAGLGLQAVDDDVTAQAQLLRNIARRRTAHVEKDDLSKASFLEYIGFFLSGSDIPHDIFISKHSFKGYLMKKGDKIKSWKQRWVRFDLQDPHRQLQYFADDRSTRALGSIKILHILRVVAPSKIANSSQGTILLVTDNRTYYLRAPTELAAQCWFKLLQAISA